MKQNFLISGKAKTISLALVVMALWGSLFPVIKIGYSSFHIDASDIPSIILFAGLRFTVSGVILLAMVMITKKDSILPKNKDIPIILWGTLASIILHYSFTYIGLAIGEGSKSAIIKQIGFLFLSCFAFLFDRNDKFSIKKVVAGILGFAGIITTSWDGSGINFKLGDLLLFLASACSAVSAIISKRATQQISPIKFVAYTQLIGGVFLCAIGLLGGGRIIHISVFALLVFLYICVASIGAYVLWNSLLKTGSISSLSIIKFTEPLFAVLFSGIFLGEKIFKASYLIALLLLLAALFTEHLPRRKNDRKYI